MLAEPSRVRVQDPFLAAWIQALVQEGVPHQWKMCEETGRLENFRRAARGENGTYVGCTYNDSDVYKVAEAAAYGYIETRDFRLKAILDEFATLITAAQAPDGYIHTSIQVNHPDQRYLSLCSRHEMYCMGHLLEACCAYEQAIPDGKMRDVATRIGDHLVRTFGPGKRKGYCGHQEIELALARAGRQFDRPEFVALAKWMTDQRGTRPSPFEQEMADPVAREFSGGYSGLVEKEGRYDGAYCQDDKPLREQTKAVGHSVRAMYQFIGALETMEPGDSELLQTLETIWDNMVTRRTYITGGIGSSGNNEGFTRDYDLPNDTAYAETCAGIGLCMWAARMAAATGKLSYVKAFQKALYNNVLAGVSLDTTKYHYDNPLESFGDHQRVPWFDCACCPPNVARFLLGLGQYAVVSHGDWVTAVLPVSSDATVVCGSGSLSVRLESQYPWKSACTVRLRSVVPGHFRFRIPGTLLVQEHDGTEAVQDGDWAVYEGSAMTEVSFEVDLAVGTKLVASHPQVLHNAGRVAVQRGPIVFCAEERDNDGPVQHLSIARDEPLTEYWSDSVQEPLTFTTQGWRDHVSTENPTTSALAVTREEVTIRLRPYYSWNNGEPGSMQVWLRSPVPDA